MMKKEIALKWIQQTKEQVKESERLAKVKNLFVREFGFEPSTVKFDANDRAFAYDGVIFKDGDNIFIESRKVQRVEFFIKELQEEEKEEVSPKYELNIGKEIIRYEWKKTIDNYKVMIKIYAW